MDLCPLNDFQNVHQPKNFRDKSNLPLIEKYKPETLQDICGNSEVISDINNWLYHPDTEEKICIVFGPPGIGKTSILNVFNKHSEFSLVPKSKLLDCIDGLKRPNVTDFFSDKPQKISVYLVDNWENSDKGFIDEIIARINPKISGKKNKKPLPIKILGMCDSQIYRKICKKKIIKTLILQRLSIENIKNYIISIVTQERKRTPPDFIDRIYKQANGDIRASLQNLEILLKSNNTRDLDLTRDQELMTPDAAQSIMLSDANFYDRHRFSNSDAYAITYTIHENYTDYINDNIPLCHQICDDLSLMDTVCNVQSCCDDVSYLEPVFGICVPTARMRGRATKPNNKLRPYKIISVSNQSIISKNKLNAARLNLSITCNMTNTELLDFVPVYAKKHDRVNEFRWFFTRLQKKH